MGFPRRALTQACSVGVDSVINNSAPSVSVAASTKLFARRHAALRIANVDDVIPPLLF